MNALIYIAGIVLLVYSVFWFLHTHYIAVMALRDARDAKKLTVLDYVFGYPTLLLGLLIDLFANIFVLTFLLVELPKEGTVTARTKRLGALPAGGSWLQRWRRGFSRWMLGQLAHHDKSGGHNVPKETT
jgi:hypothetical protein